MPDQIASNSTIVAAVVVVGAVLVFLIWLKRQLGGGVEALPYQPVASLLTPAEMVFYRVLAGAISGMPVVVFAKVRILDLLEIPRGTESHQGYRARVQSKHVDFVLCDAATARPMLVIELDDASHQRRDRAERDAFVDRVMQTIGLPIWHVTCAKKYSPVEIRQGVSARLQNAPGDGV